MTWDRVQGQTQAIALLQRALVCDRVANGYIFHGAAGVGKALTARLFTQALLKDHHAQPMDLLWIAPTYKKGDRLYTRAEAQAQNITTTGLPQVRLEQIRVCSRFLASRPSVASRKVVVIEGATTMAESPANALLKTLEEPGQGVLILLADQLHGLLPTIRSRCQLIPFYRLPDALVQTLVGQEAAPELLAMAQGSPGALTEILQQSAQLPPGLLANFSPWPQQPIPLLTLAREVTERLNLDGQLWLVDYLQQRLWLQQLPTTWLYALEDLRRQLTHHSQPRLAWEVALLKTLCP